MIEQQTQIKYNPGDLAQDILLIYTEN